jgi:hypothetical protein
MLPWKDYLALADDDDDDDDDEVMKASYGT